MGLFDSLFKAQAPTSYSYIPKNEQEAWVAVMYACLAIDGNVSKIEIDNLCRMTVLKSFFKGYDILDLYKSTMSVHRNVGSKSMIDSATPLISEENKGTVLALVMELVLADGVLDDREKEIVDYLAGALNINAEFAYKVVEVILLKNKYNVIL